MSTRCARHPRTCCLCLSLMKLAGFHHRTFSFRPERQDPASPKTISEDGGVQIAAFVASSVKKVLLLGNVHMLVWLTNCRGRDNPRVSGSTVFAPLVFLWHRASGVKRRPLTNKNEDGFMSQSCRNQSHYTSLPNFTWSISDVDTISIPNPGNYMTLSSFMPSS